MDFNCLCMSTDYLCHVLSQITQDKLMRDTNLALVIVTHSWREQFIEAVTINAGQSLFFFHLCFVLIQMIE